MQKGVEKVYVKNRDSRATPISTLFLVFPLFKYIYIYYFSCFYGWVWVSICFLEYIQVVSGIASKASFKLVWKALVPESTY